MEKKTVTFVARFKNLAMIDTLAAKAAKSLGLDKQSIYSVQMAVDEACSNIIEHAYGGESDNIIEYTHEIHDDRLVVTLRDYGAPFDPTYVNEPDLCPNVDEREIGGLGYFFMCKLMDELEFEFTSDQGNLLTMVKYKGEGSNITEEAND